MSWKDDSSSKKDIDINIHLPQNMSLIYTSLPTVESIQTNYFTMKTFVVTKCDPFQKHD